MIGAALNLVATGAQAGDASDLASRGGFLLGHAYRCGTPTELLQASAQLIHNLASALAADESEKAEADKTFAERFVVSAVADKVGGLVPPCASVKRELAQLEHHNPETVASGSSTAPEQTYLTDGAADHGPSKRARAARMSHSHKPPAHKLAGRQASRHAPLI